MVIDDSTVVLSPIATSPSLVPEHPASGAAAAGRTTVAATTTVARAVESRDLPLRTEGLLRRVLQGQAKVTAPHSPDTGPFGWLSAAISLLSHGLRHTVERIASDRYAGRRHRVDLTRPRFRGNAARRRHDPRPVPGSNPRPPRPPRRDAQPRDAELLANGPQPPGTPCVARGR